MTRSSVIVVLVAAAFASLRCRGCDERKLVAASSEARSVLVLSAFDGELEPMLAATTSLRRVDRGGRTYYTGVLAGDHVVLGLTGGGVQRARAASEAALAAFSVSAVVFVGVAGGVDPHVGIGDVIVPAEWGQHDTGREPAWFAVDAKLAALVPTRIDGLAACGHPACAHEPHIYVGGRGVSGSRFIDDPDQANDLWRQHTARVVDMETSAVAEVAHAAKLPFLGFRAVSDVTTTGLSRDHMNRYWRLAARNAAEVAIAFFERLSL